MEIIRATTTAEQAGAYYVRIQAMAVRHHISLYQEFDEHDTPETKYIVITDDVLPVATCRLYPLEATFGYAPAHPCIAFIGEDDPWSDVGKLRQTAAALQIPVYAYPGCNHSLECGDVTRDLSVLQNVMEKTARFLEDNTHEETH